MRNKDKKKLKKFIKKVIGMFMALIIAFICSKTEILTEIDNTVFVNNILKNNETIAVPNMSGVSGIKNNSEIVEKVSENVNIDENKLNIFFFDVGQADCQLILYKDKSLLIDAGNNGDGEYIVDGLKALGISKLDYVIGTHVHEDHIGGMNYIIDYFEVDKFYLPYDTMSTTTYYKKLLNSLVKKGMAIEEAVVGEKFSLDDLQFEIMSVDNSEPDNTNLTSIVLEMTYGDLKYLFMGDAEKENEEARSWNDIDVLKVGHHGSNTSTTQEFLNQVLPEISIISVGEGNSYGLPKEKILTRLEKIGTKIYRTDKDGTIQIISDGKTNEVVKININFDSSQN